ncbi:hypothetical protein LR013_02930 [candidate division NPL-UPA2 bacterium]|nr:hypothetical protein [candidate division NPL-UPA2 bacterium]
MGLSQIYGALARRIGTVPGTNLEGTMPEDSLSALEKRVGKLIELTIKLKEEKKRWEKEESVLKSKVEGIIKEVEKVIGEE